jgi:hypothetical protein
MARFSAQGGLEAQSAAAFCDCNGGDASVFQLARECGLPRIVERDEQVRTGLVDTQRGLAGIRERSAAFVCRGFDCPVTSNCGRGGQTRAGPQGADQDQQRYADEQNVSECEIVFEHSDCSESVIGLQEAELGVTVFGEDMLHHGAAARIAEVETCCETARPLVVRADVVKRSQTRRAVGRAAVVTEGPRLKSAAAGIPEIVAVVSQMTGVDEKTIMGKLFRVRQGFVAAAGQLRSRSGSIVSAGRNCLVRKSKPAGNDTKA